jgi:hypothetical protein
MNEVVFKSNGSDHVSSPLTPAGRPEVHLDAWKKIALS